MKLYTELQVKQMIEKSRETGLTAEYLIATSKGIELPSDEEIFSESLNHKEPDDFNCGSQFVIDYINQQDK